MIQSDQSDRRRNLTEHRRSRLGVVYIAAGIALNQWTIGYLFSADGTVDKPVFVVGIWLVDLALIAVGISILMRRRPTDWKTAGFKLAALALSLLVVEGVLWTITLVAGLGRDDRDPRSLLSPYQGKEWATCLFEEIHDIEQAKQFERHPFLGWHMKEYHGDCINVNSDGCRKTWNPTYPPDKRIPSIYVLGGSAIWGIGERDDYTIPSDLSHMLHADGFDYVVRNYGDVAYTFTQELLHLTLLLKEGRRPAYVLFYDGANDVYGAYRKGEPGGLLDPLGIQDEFAQRRTPVEHFWYGVSGLLAKYSKIYQYASKITTIASPSPKFPEVGARFDDEQLQRLAEGIVDYYAASQALLGRLAQAYGFDYLTFWQPITLLEDHLYDEEKTDIRVGDTRLAKLHKLVRKTLKARKLNSHYDVADALSHRTTACYIDYCHLSENGNAVVAAKLYDILKPRLKLQHVAQNAVEAEPIHK